MEKHTDRSKEFVCVGIFKKSNCRFNEISDKVIPISNTDAVSHIASLFVSSCKARLLAQLLLRVFAEWLMCSFFKNGEIFIFLQGRTIFKMRNRS